MPELEHGTQPPGSAPAEGAVPGYESEPQPDPAPFNGFIWCAWVWMAWLFPAFLFMLLWAGEAGGWEQLILLLASPLLVPLYALLNLLPRRIIRKRTSQPNGSTTLTCLLLLHWWGLAILAVFFRGTGDSGGVSSFAGELLWWLPPVSEQWFSLLGGGISGLAWLAVLLSSLRSTGRRYPNGPKQRWIWTSAALLVPPLAILLALVTMYGSSLNGERDAAGNRESDVLALTVEETRAAQNARWDALQGELVGLRSGISASGWTAERTDYSSSGIVDGSGLGFGFELESFRDPLPSYTLEVIWRTTLEERYADARDRVSALASQQGWKSEASERFTEVDAAGHEILVAEELRFSDTRHNRFGIKVSLPRDDLGQPLEDGLTVVTVYAQSPEFWKEGGYLYEWADAATPAELNEFAGATFSGSDWPELRLFQARRY